MFLLKGETWKHYARDEQLKLSKYFNVRIAVAMSNGHVHLLSHVYIPYLQIVDCICFKQC